MREALAIGVGTMVGAGIFVFPGLAAGRTGPGAIVSFALGAGIALLVALPASELATAMPQSGGGYYYVSRGLGALAGSAVGLGQWIGLMFASAFYLVGFGHYLNDLLAEIGVSHAVSVRQLAVAAAVVLTALAITGAERTGSLQNTLVTILVGVFVVFLAYGVVAAIGSARAATMPRELLPFGPSPVFTTAALVFTSYLGFAQIATVAGDIRDPGRVLPRAMLGSVAIVGILYVLMILVSTSTFGAARLAELGETAAVEVARRLLGAGGAAVIMAAGLLATLSSANASIMSASRAVYALSKDDLFPARATRLNARFGTPDVALLLAGIPTVLLILTGRTETLAEVASLLHLVMYGLLCFALLALRRRAPVWYDPAFTTPGYPAVPVLGGAASLALIAFMGRVSVMLGVVVVVGAIIWHLLYARDVRTRVGVAAEVPMVSGIVGTEVLVPVLLPDPDPLPAPLEDVLAHMDVVLLGVYEVPKQAAVEQARDQRAEDAERTLQEWAEPLRRHHGELDTRLVFTQSSLDTVERVVAEEAPDALLVPRSIGGEAIHTILVAVATSLNADRISRLTAGLAAHADADVTVLTIVPPQEQPAPGHRVLAHYRDLLTAEEVAPERLELRRLESDELAGTLVEVAGDTDLIVLGESDPEVPETVLGPVPRRVAEDSGRPVLVVRYPGRRREEGGGGESADPELHT